MKEWIFVIDKKHEAALGKVRCISGLRAARQGDKLWLSGWPMKQPLPLELKQLPAKHTFRLNEKQQLFPSHGLTPVMVLPDLKWEPLPIFIPVRLPTAALPAEAPKGLELRLVASPNAHQGVALLVGLHAWIAYVETAPQVRLDRWRYAVSEEREVLVLGTPLPPLPGREYWQYESMLLPGGYDFEYAFLRKAIQEKINPEKDARVLWTENGAWQCIPNEDFLPVSRSGVRQLEYV